MLIIHSQVCIGNAAANLICAKNSAEMRKIVEKIEFSFDNETVEFFVLEETKINEVNYILVTEEEEGDAEALILKDISDSEEEEAIYEIVEDDTELDCVSKIFSEMLEDIDIEK